MIRKVLLVNSRQFSSSTATDLSEGGFSQGHQLIRCDITQLVFLDCSVRQLKSFGIDAFIIFWIKKRRRDSPVQSESM